MDVVRRDRRRPGDSALVVALLDDRGHHAARPDPVAAAEQRLLAPVLVEERRLQRLRVLRPEVEDVADLDRRLEPERAAAFGTAVALDRLADVRETRRVVPTRLDPEQVPAVPVRARDELALAERVVREDLAAEADGA